MIIDFHVHTFMDSLCPNTVNKLAVSALMRPMTDGSFGATCKYLREEGVDAFVVQNIAVTAHNMKKVNDYAISINGKEQDGVKCIAFGSINPFAPDALDEIDRLYDSGIRGVKFHNEYQNFLIDDEEVFNIYEKLIDKRFTMLFHGGEDKAFSPPVKATPKRMRRLYDCLPYEKYVFAHMGGYNLYDEGIQYLASDTKVNVDLALATHLKSADKLKEIILAFSPGRVLFGSDCPWDSPKAIKNMVDFISFPYEDNELIFHKNAERLLSK